MDSMNYEHKHSRFVMKLMCNITLLLKSIDNVCSVGRTNIYGIFFMFSLNSGIFCEVLSVPHDIVMDLNDVMDTCVRPKSIIPSHFVTDTHHRRPAENMVLWVII